MIDDRFDEILADYDEQLAQGLAPKVSEIPVNPELERRLIEAAACLDLLESTFPRQGDATLDDRLEAQAFATLFPQPATLGRFVIRRELGRGGHGVVFLAFDPILKREVALKVPRAEMLPSPEMRSRFRREAEAAARLDHPHLIPVHEAGEIGPICYLVSAYCPGPTLATWLRGQGRPVDPVTVARLVAPLADAVDSMHRNGILHRDLKPGNVILQPRNDFPDIRTDDASHFASVDSFVPRITDFGLAHLAENPEFQTRTGSIVGTPGYMAPEQALGERSRIGPATDVYSLGVLLYELLTGRLPFLGATELDTLRQVKDDDPTPIRRLRRDVSRDLETVSMKCLEKDPVRRYATARELADDLRRVIAGEPIRARPVGMVGRFSRWCRRRPVAALLVLTTTTALLSLLGMTLVRQWELTNHAASLEHLNTQLSVTAREAREQRHLAEVRARQVSEGLYAIQISQAAQAIREGDLPEAVSLLAGWRPGPREPDLRGFEFAYLERQIQGAGRQLFSTPESLYHLVRSPDGKTIATGGKDAIVWLLEEKSGKVVGEIVTHQIEVNGIAFSEDGSELVTTGDDGTVRFWNLPDGTERLSVPAHPGKAYQVVYLPDGENMAVCGNDPLIRVIRVSTGELQYTLAGHTDQVQSLTLDPAGVTLLSTSSDQTTRLWNLEHRVCRSVARSNQRTGPVAVLEKQPTFLVGTDAGTVEHRDLKDGRELGAVAHLDHVRSLIPNRQGTLVAAGDSRGGIRLWRLLAGGDFEPQPAASWHAHDQGVNSLLWSNDGESLLSAGDDGKLAEWNLAMALEPQASIFAVTPAPRAQMIPNTDWLVTTGLPLTIWNWRTGAMVQTISDGFHHRVAVSSDGRTLATTADHGTLRVYRRLNPTGNDPFELAAEWISGGELTRVDISLDSTSIAVARWLEGQGGGKPEHAIWIVALPDLGQKERIPVDSASQMAFAPDGDRLVLRTRDGLAMWSRRQQRVLWNVAQADAESLTFSDYGNLLFSRFDARGVIIREANTGDPVSRLGTSRNPLDSLVVSTDGRTLATASESGEIRLIHIPTGRPLYDLPNPGGRASVVGFSSDGKSLVCLVQVKSDPKQYQIVVFHGADPSPGAGKTLTPARD
ncbi:MAG: protein kinase [Planctomycetota bacterium]|nr:protein kinase [Planctomycetota bacterium]